MHIEPFKVIKTSQLHLKIIFMIMSQGDTCHPGTCLFFYPGKQLNGFIWYLKYLLPIF